MKILIVRLTAIGDTILTTPLASAVGHYFPEAELHWLVEAPGDQVLLNNPHIDRLWVFDHATSAEGKVTRGPAHQIIPRLRAQKFDAVLDPQGLLKSAWWSWLAGAKLRIGTSLAREQAFRLYNRTVTPPPDLTVSERYVYLLTGLGVTPQPFPMLLAPTAPETAAADSLLGELGEYSGWVGMVPATTFPNKHWTERHWAKLHGLLESELNLLPVYLGAKPDLPLINAISQRLAEPMHNLVGKTTLMEAVAVLQRCKAAVAVDTALMHAAIAVNTPTVGLFGPSIWQGFEKRKDVIHLHKDFSCMPCHRRPTCASYACMPEIQPHDVVDQLIKLIGAPGSFQPVWNMAPES